MGDSYEGGSVVGGSTVGGSGVGGDLLQKVKHGAKAVFNVAKSGSCCHHTYYKN